MAFSTNYAEVKESELVPPGKYEVIIAEAKEIVTKNGSYGIQLATVIRNDIEQKCKNRNVFHTLWKKKEPDEKDNMVDGYSFKQIMQLAKACQLPDGKNYKNLAEMLGEVVRKCVQVTVQHEEYNGNTNVRVQYINSTAFPDCKHVFQPKATTVSQPNIPYQAPVQAAQPTYSAPVQPQFEEMSLDDDLPF